MINSLLVLFLLSSFSLSSYKGEDEVLTIFSSVSNLCNPSLEDYKLIEDFLQNGERIYLNYIYNSELQRLIPPESIRHRDCRHLMLVGLNNELPIFEVHHINTSSESKERCITLYSSYNSPYPSKARLLLEEIKRCGYQGHVILRIGGYPNIDHEGLALCHIPYSWKVAFVQEAISLGYENILWLDCSMHPMTDLSRIFQMIERDGYLFLTGGVNLDYGYELKTHLPIAIESLGVKVNKLNEIPHIVSCIFGINSSSEKGLQVINEWYEETKRVIPCMTWFPEELALSVVSWRLNANPLMHWGLVVCTDENKHLEKSFPDWSFLLDLNRGYKE